MDKIQIIATVGSVFIIIFILFLIRDKRLKVEYSLLWLFFSFIFLGLSIWKSVLDKIADFVGIVYAPAALFLILIMIFFIMMIEFSLIISKQSEWIKQSAQDIGILKFEVEKLNKKLEEADSIKEENPQENSGEKPVISKEELAD